MRNSFRIIFFLFLLNLSVYAQDKKFDSLWQVIHTTKIDTVKIKALSRLAFILKNSDPDTSIVIAKQILALSRDKKLLLQRGPYTS